MAGASLALTPALTPALALALALALTLALTSPHLAPPSYSPLYSHVERQLDADRLSADRYLHVVMCDHDGWVPISTLLAYPTMRKLCFPQVPAVAHVLEKQKNKLHKILVKESLQLKQLTQEKHHLKKYHKTVILEFNFEEI